MIRVIYFVVTVVGLSAVLFVCPASAQVDLATDSNAWDTEMGSKESDIAKTAWAAYRNQHDVALFESLMKQAVSIGSNIAVGVLCLNYQNGMTVPELLKPAPEGEKLCNELSAIAVDARKKFAYSHGMTYSDGSNVSDAEDIERAVNQKLPNPSLISNQSVDSQNENQKKDLSAQKILTKFLDEMLTDDSKSWVLNHYDHHSVSNAQILAGSVASGTYQLRGNYNYNNGQPGWVTVSVEHNKEHCLTYFDFPSICRQPHDLNILVKGIAALAILSAASDSAHPSGAYSHSANSINETSKQTTAEQWSAPEDQDYYGYTNPKYKKAEAGYQDAVNNPYGQPPSSASSAYKSGFSSGQTNEIFRRNSISSEQSDE